MNCKKAEDLLVGYMYQELSAKQVVEVERHLEVCDRCAKTLESWRAIHQGYRKSAEEEPQPPSYLKQKLLIAAKEELVRKPSFSERFSLLLKPALILPILVFVLLTILYLPWQPAKQNDQARIPAQAPELLENKNRMEAVKTDRLEQRAATNATAPKLKAYAQKETSKDQVPGDKGEATDERRSQPSSLSYDSARTSAAPPPAAPAYEPEPQREKEVPQGSVSGGLAAPQEQEEAAQQKSLLQNQPVSASKKVSDQAELDNSYYNEAQSRFRNDDLKGGVKIAKQAIERDNAKTLAVQFHQTGIQYQQSRECGKAIPQFLLIVNNYSDYPDLQNVLMRLADCYEEIGQIDSARRVYLRLLAYPSSHDVAAQKIQQLDKKIQSQEELKALGYTNDKN